MPKRYGNLWNKFMSQENIDNALNKALKGRRDREEVKAFLKNKDKLMQDIIEMLKNNSYPPHSYRKRTIYEGKKRDIFIVNFYPWRVIHHMLINILEEIFVPSFIKHTYGCIKGRGQHLGSVRCIELVNKYNYVLKCDIRKFYPSINQDILYKLIQRKVKDKRLLRVIKEVVYSHELGGLPIGNLPSQLFGNVYMSLLDNFVKHDLRCKTYIRYVDDFLFFSNDKKQLHNYKEQVESFINSDTKLRLSKFSVFKVNQGVDFLGYRHFRNYKLLRKRTASRIRRTVGKLVDKYTNNKISYPTCLSILGSYDGLMKYCNSYNLQEFIKLNNIKASLSLQECNSKKQAPVIGTPTRIRDIKDREVVINAFYFNKNFTSLQVIKDKIMKVTTRSKVARKQLLQIPCLPVSAEIKSYCGLTYIK